MKSIITLAVIAALAGCANLDMQDMTAAQIRATNGTASCGTAKSIYGTVSIITANTNDPAKGNAEKGTVKIVCGDASMTIDSNVSPK